MKSFNVGFNSSSVFEVCLKWVFEMATTHLQNDDGQCTIGFVAKLERHYLIFVTVVLLNE